VVTSPQMPTDGVNCCYMPSSDYMPPTQKQIHWQMKLAK